MRKLAAWTVFAVGACGGDKPTVEVRATGLDHPVDVALNADGTRAFALSATRLVAIDEGEGPTPIHEGAPFVDARGLVFDDDANVAYVADPGAGAIFEVSMTGAVTPLPGGDGLHAVALDFQGGTLFIAGLDGDGDPAIFTLDPAMTGATAIAAKGALRRPGGVAAVGASEAFVTDAGRLFRVRGGEIEALGAPFRDGSPAGTAITLDGTLVLSSALSLDGGAAVVFTDLELGTQTTFTDEIESSPHAGGLHRARDVDAFVWADRTDRVVVIRTPPRS